MKSDFFLYKTYFWLKRASAAMAKTKAMCIINRSTKLIGIQHEKKHGKGCKNSSDYFDSKIEIEHESDILIADYSFDECNYFKEDDDFCVKKNFSRQSNNKFRDRPHMIQAEFENGIEDENNFQIQEIDFQNGIDEDDA